MFMYFENRGRGCHPGMRHGMRGGWGHHGRHWGGRGERGAHGKGRSRRMFDGGELRLVLLKLIADEPRHGYDLIRQIEESDRRRLCPEPRRGLPDHHLARRHGLHRAAAERRRQEGVRDHRRPAPPNSRPMTSWSTR